MAMTKPNGGVKVGTRSFVNWNTLPPHWNRLGAAKQRLHVASLAPGDAVEALRPAFAAFVVDAAFGHVNAGGARQEQEAVLDKAKTPRIG
ncbi:hypothetical protein [Rhizobium sp. Rhizsp42]|uniref:hypothetical protein n=1 Tax=Rhizobium sp. Rhizsp42 TaxID=3243034 RepID=UPI0039AED9D5